MDKASFQKIQTRRNGSRGSLEISPEVLEREVQTVFIACLQLLLGEENVFKNTKLDLAGSTVLQELPRASPHSTMRLVCFREAEVL